MGSKPTVGGVGASRRPQHSILRPLATLLPPPTPGSFLGCLGGLTSSVLGIWAKQVGTAGGAGLRLGKTRVEVPRAEQPLLACLGLSLVPGDPTQAQGTKPQRMEGWISWEMELDSNPRLGVAAPE